MNWEDDAAVALAALTLSAIAVGVIGFSLGLWVGIAL
jgi:hypothetical protein